MAVLSFDQVSIHMCYFNADPSPWRLLPRKRDVVPLFTGDGDILMGFKLSTKRNDNVLHVPNRQDGCHTINLVEVNERCKRPMPSWTGTKSGDTVQCEFDTGTDGVLFEV